MNRQGINRDKYLIENLKKKHEIHIIQHTQPFKNKLLKFLNPKLLLKSLKDWTMFKEGIYHHHIRHSYFTRFNQVLKFNNQIFKKKIKNIVKSHKIEVIICGPNYYLHGYPPVDLNVPIIFDYVDFLHDFKDPNRENSRVLEKYYKIASLVLCVSKTLKQSIPERYKEKAIYLPNGVDLNFFNSYQNSKEDTDIKYISLIGLGVSESLFYLNIFPKIKAEVKNIKLLLVGGGIRYSPIKNYVSNKKNPSDYIFTGFTQYKDIRKYFFMSDVGLYPSLQNRYYDSACPIKIMEYSAAHKPVVSTDLEEVRRLNFPNVLLSKPTSSDFIKKIIMALDYKGSFPNLENFDWMFLSKKLEKHLQKI